MWNITNNFPWISNRETLSFQKLVGTGHEGASLVAQNRHPRDRRSTSEPTAREAQEKGNAERGQVWGPVAQTHCGAWCAVERVGSLLCGHSQLWVSFHLQDADSSITGASDMLLLKTHCSLMIWSARGSHFNYSLTVAQRLSFTSPFIFRSFTVERIHLK